MLVARESKVHQHLFLFLALYRDYYDFRLKQFFLSFSPPFAKLSFMRIFFVTSFEVILTLTALASQTLPEFLMIFY